MLIPYLIDKILIYHFSKDKYKHHIYRYIKNSTIIKSGHRPHMAFRLLHGAVVVYFRNKQIGVFGPHTTWGNEMLLKNQTSQYTVYIIKGSRVCAIGKSEFQNKLIKFLNFFQFDFLEKPHHLV